MVGSPPVQINAMSVDSTILPYIIQTDPEFVRVEVSIYGATVANSSPSVVSGKNQFSGTVAIDLTAGDNAIQFLGRSYDPTQIGWEASTPVSAGYRFVDDNGCVQLALSSTGSTGSLEPVVFTIAGQYQDLSANVTNISIDNNNTLTVTANNNFAAGMSLSFNDLQQAMFLNGQIITVNPSPTSTSFTATFVHAAYSSAVAEVGTTGVVTVDGGVTWENVGFYTITPTVQFTIIPYQSGLAPVIGSPSGITSYKAQAACRIEWLMPSFAGTVGTKVMLSTDPAGVNPPYVQFGDAVPTTQVSRTQIVVLSGTTTTSYDPTTGQQVITTNNSTQEFTYNYVDVTPTDVNGATQFYAMLSTVVQDPTTNAMFESQQSGPVTCGFINLSLASPADFLALQRQQDIAGRLIAQINRLYPDLDLTPRTEMRDLLIDPVAVELSNMSVREWFSRCALSVSAMSQIDNASGNGISDPFNSSPVKQQIARAYGLSASDTQTFIDQQFDHLGQSAGLTRGGATASVATLTFYTYTLPTQTTTFPIGIICSTTGDSSTPSVSFVTTGSASITPSSAPSFYNPIYGWWAVSVPASCQTTGSSTNVGAGTIVTVNSNAPAGWSVTNLASAVFGTDEESNSHFASRIQTKLITGIDSSTRNGYYNAAIATPGIVAANVVAAGDLEMLRDWDNIRQKHVYGCVDIYCQGTSSSEEDDIVAFQYENNGTLGLYATYSLLQPTSITSSLLQFTMQNAALNALDWPMYQGVELLVSGNAGSFFLDISEAQINKAGGTISLNPSANAYYISGSGVTQVRIPYPSLASPITNLAAVQGLGNNATYSLLVRLQSPLQDVPTNQPVTNVNSVIGQTSQTGTIPEAMLDLVYTSDFLLYGGSNEAGDTVQVASTPSSPVTQTIVASLSTPVLIGTAMDVPVSQTGAIGDVLSVRSTDLSTLYVNGTDYALVALPSPSGTPGGPYVGSYRTYGLELLTSSKTITNVAINNNILTLTCNNSFGVGAPLTLDGLTTATFLNGQSIVVATSNGASLTAVYSHNNYGPAPDTGKVTGSAIQDGQQVVVSYNQFTLYERLSFASGEAQTLNGSVSNALDNNGFVYNTWLPESYGRFDLTLDGAAYNADGTINVTGSTGLVGALVPHDNRYIKVVYDGTVMLENQDYILAVSGISGTATVARNLGTNATSRIPDGGQVLVSYFYDEAFTVASEYPAFVPFLVNQINLTKAAACDVLVKAMVANPIDVTLTVTLDSGTSADTVDSDIRTAIDQALNTATTTLYQSNIITLVSAVNGVKSVSVPLIKCAKSDGSYDIGFVIPTGTLWTSLAADPVIAAYAASIGLANMPTNGFITASAVLPDSTVPSGGPAEAFVGLLYQGQEYARTYSLKDFLQNAATPTTSSGNGSFYIVGSADPGIAAASQSAYAQKVLITIPLDTTSPSLKYYFVTYQVFGESSAKDVTLSSTEYFTAGRVTINYITTGS
jgi:uncharacterized phage protein gp47/JayE